MDVIYDVTVAVIVSALCRKRYQLVSQVLVNRTLTPQPVEFAEPVPEGKIPVPEGFMPVPEGIMPVPEGVMPVPEGTMPVPEGTMPVPEGKTPVRVSPVAVGGKIPVPEGIAPVPDGMTPVPEGRTPVPVGPTRVRLSLTVTLMDKVGNTNVVPILRQVLSLKNERPAVRSVLTV